MSTLRKPDLARFLQNLGGRYRVIAPIRSGDEVAFGDFDPDTFVPEYFGRTRFSPKEFLFPEAEVMFTFSISKSGSEVSIDEDRYNEQTVVWGVRPCDLAGFRVLDAVFLSDPVDVYYRARRANTLLLALNCNRPDQSCFCASFGSGPFAPGGFDLAFTDLGDRYLVECGSETGKQLLEGEAELFHEAEKSDEQKAAVLERESKAAFSTTLDVEAVVRKLPAMYGDDVWAEASRKCTVCGTCCIVCPACHCFNVEDVLKTRKIIQRIRYWDACQFSGFTHMAQGASRETQAERWRQKIYDKFSYIPSKYGGLLGCTGCGRCLDLCQGNISIVDVLTEVAR